MKTQEYKGHLITIKSGIIFALGTTFKSVSSAKKKIDSLH